MAIDINDPQTRQNFDQAFHRPESNELNFQAWLDSNPQIQQILRDPRYAGNSSAQRNARQAAIHAVVVQAGRHIPSEKKVNADGRLEHDDQSKVPGWGNALIGLGLGAGAFTGAHFLNGLLAPASSVPELAITSGPLAGGTGGVTSAGGIAGAAGSGAGAAAGAGGAAGAGWLSHLANAAPGLLAAIPSLAGAFGGGGGSGPGGGILDDPQLRDLLTQSLQLQLQQQQRNAPLQSAVTSLAGRLLPNRLVDTSGIAGANYGPQGDAQAPPDYLNNLRGLTQGLH